MSLKAELRTAPSAQHLPNQQPTLFTPELKARGGCQNRARHPYLSFGDYRPPASSLLAIQCMLSHCFGGNKAKHCESANFWFTRPPTPTFSVQRHKDVVYEMIEFLLLS